MRHSAAMRRGKLSKGKILRIGFARKSFLLPRRCDVRVDRVRGTPASMEWKE